MAVRSAAVNAPNRTISIEAGTTGLTWAVGDDGRLHQLSFGAAGTVPPEFPVGLFPLAYPTSGEEPLREPALRVTHLDGAVSTRLRFDSVTRRPVDDGEEVRVHMVDRAAPMEVTLVVRTRPDHDLIEQWVEVVNLSGGQVVLHQASASAPAFAGADAHLTHWGGGWAGEWTETTERLTPGTKTVASAGGVRPSLVRTPVVLLAPDGPATETSGSVGLCTVLWGGDVRFDAEMALHHHVRLVAGHQHRGAERILGPGERFESPHVAWIWSEEGVGPTSRAMHRFVRKRIVRDGNRSRAIVANTWEAVGFSLDQPGLVAQVDGAADLGAELFLLDDGWFGTVHPRDDDTTGLGDWSVDLGKLPDGLDPLISHTLDRGLRFGLWVEPEMVNPRSDLYRIHPDWVIGEPGRDRREERSQLVLDLCRPEVREFVVDVIDRILTEHPGISYLKWDANRDITEPGSPSLDQHRQTHLAVDRVRATDEVMAEVARRHPDVELMLCASGGGRSDLATLGHFHEIWTSDNTDPVDRVRIQWGASHLLPANVVGAHVTRWGQRPIAFGCAVAMSGRFGFDLDVTALDEEERRICRDAVEAYGTISDLVQQGDLYRLVSPVGRTRSALAYMDAEGGRAVVFAYRLPDDSPTAEGPTLQLPSPMWARGGWEARDLTPGCDASKHWTGVEGDLDWPEGDGPVARVVEMRRVRGAR